MSFARVGDARTYNGDTVLTSSRTLHGMHTTWRPVAGGAGEPRAKLPNSAFAFPRERKEPLTDAGHVRGAIARFGQVHGATGPERAQAFANIRAAAAYYGVSIHAGNWHDLMG